MALCSFSRELFQVFPAYFLVFTCYYERLQGRNEEKNVVPTAAFDPLFDVEDLPKRWTVQLCIISS